MGKVGDLAAMRLLLEQWKADDARMTTPAGRWAVELRSNEQVIGGATPATRSRVATSANDALR
jgi:hypothetical protein